MWYIGINGKIELLNATELDIKNTQFFCTRCMTCGVELTEDDEVGYCSEHF
jgi:hypothetical protein